MNRLLRDASSRRRYFGWPHREKERVYRVLKAVEQLRPGTVKHLIHIVGRYGEWLKSWTIDEIAEELGVWDTNTFWDENIANAWEGAHETAKGEGLRGAALESRTRKLEQEIMDEWQKKHIGEIESVVEHRAEEFGLQVVRRDLATVYFIPERGSRWIDAANKFAEEGNYENAKKWAEDYGYFSPVHGVQEVVESDILRSLTHEERRPYFK